MRFRVRNYSEEEASVTLLRQPAEVHPLSTAVVPPALQSPQRSSHFLVEPSTTPPVDDVFVDPLRAIVIQDPLSSPQPALPKGERLSPQSAVTSKLNKDVQSSATDWEVHRTSILRQFTSSGTIKVSRTLDVLSKQIKGRAKALTASHIQELDDIKEDSSNEIEIISQEEYVTRLRELNHNISQAWKNNERVATLRFAVKVAKLLSDTSVPRFYPTLFILATDILETIGSLVWERIKGKAEEDDDGKALKHLPEKFTADDVPQHAKDTCGNWFYKIGSIQELLPRIYLEIAILPCMYFIQKDPPISEFQRLNMMIRGLSDPLVAAYARIYLARKGQTIFPHEIGHLIVGLDDFLLLYRRLLSGEFEKNLIRSGINRQAYINLIEPLFELYLHYICASANKEELLFMMRTFCDQSSSNAERSAPISVLLHHLLKWLPAAIISISALELSRILKQSTDISKSQYLNYRLLAMKLCECHPPRDLRLSILNDIWKVVSRFDDRVEYLIVTDVFVEFVVQCCSENELHVLLRDILKHLGTAMPADNAFEVLESIVLKIIRTAADINCLIKMPYFADLVNNLDGKRKYSAHKEILLFISRQKQTISDPVIRNFVFETSKSLCKSLDSLSSEAELRQIAHLISYFIQLVYIDQGLEQHFSFLLDCREGFPKMDPVKETIVHRSNRLAMDALRMSKKEVTHSVADFVRTCVTFNEITISFLKNVPSRIYLYIETAEVAMMNGLVSHSESLIRSCFESLQELQSMDNAEVARMEMELLGCIQKLCSLLIMIPSHPEQGTINLLKDLVQTYDELRFKETSKIQVFLGILLACNALSQDILPYHVESVQMISNDDLFNGDDSYLEELRDFTLRIVKGIMSISRKLPGNSARDIFETFAVVFECIDDENMQHYFSTLAETAKPVIATTDMSLEAIK